MVKTKMRERVLLFELLCRFLFFVVLLTIIRILSSEPKTTDKWYELVQKESTRAKAKVGQTCATLSTHATKNRLKCTRV
jgi:hypothetical protein